MKREFRSTALDIAIVLVCGALALTLAVGIAGRRTTTSDNTVSAPRILIDPGHGGMDSGASSADGTREKAINLAIALPLRDMLAVMGYPVSMTRMTDTEVNVTGNTVREKKVSDMRNRLAMVEQADLTISIHQNFFPQSQYSGTQIFHSANTPESHVLAESVRTQVVTLLQPENTRELKRGNADIYLLHRATRPIILVECGFLSNPAELAKLKQPEYQRQLAFALTTGVLSY